MIKEAHKWISAPIWTSDLRVYNVQQMLDSSQPILIPSKELGQASSEVQQREQHEQFLLSVAIRTVARPFGKAALNFHTRHAFKDDESFIESNLKQKNENIKKNNFINSSVSQMGARPICLNGRVHPGWHQVDFPLNDTNPSHKLAMDWANFYNGLAHGFSYCGGFPSRIFSSLIKEEANSDLLTTIRAGLLLAAGLSGCIKDSMNLYDIHALLTQNDKYLIIALLIGCAAAHRGTSEVHVYKMISAHLPFLLQPTLVEFKIELSIQSAAIVSLGLLFAETANHNISSQLLNQISLEVPCESDQAFERYSFVLTAGMAIGLINLGKGKEITDTEIPISSTPSLKERLIKLLNGGERRLAYLSYDRVECPGMRIGNFASSCGGGSNLIYSLRRYTAGGSAMDGIGAVNVTGNNAGGSSTNTATAQQQHQNSSSSRDYSGIGQPMSNHVRELPTLNIHLTSPAAAVALGLMYLRTRDEWIYEALSVKDSFYEIDKIRPDMLMIRTFCRCLVKFDDIQPTKQWTEKQIPEIVRRYSQHFVEAQTLKDIWWEEFIDVETISKVHFYCTAGALLALSLRFASSCQKDALSLIHQLYERISSIDLNRKKVDELSWSGFALRAGRNCLRTCTNVCALAMGLLMAGSGDLQTTRILRKIRNILPSFEDTNIKTKTSANCIPPKDSSVHSLHVSTNMALGLLYFGYGRYRLSDSNLSIAALVLSLFPLFPHSITDNRFYFQPLRFLWILAAQKNSQPKCLRKLSKRRKIRRILINEEEKDFEGEDEQEMMTVECPRCGRIEITKNERFSSL
uniref:Anaphase-promoting complex subunit 1 n=1 Tax=Meloidogyne incognita TaxID=6306 RepID=A0A914MLX5_MELIC